MNAPEETTAAADDALEATLTYMICSKYLKLIPSFRFSLITPYLLLSDSL